MPSRGFCHIVFGHSRLFRISDFGFRIFRHAYTSIDTYAESGTISTGRTYNLTRSYGLSFGSSDSGKFSAGNTQVSVDGALSQYTHSEGWNYFREDSKGNNNPIFYRETTAKTLSDESSSGQYHADANGRAANGGFHRENTSDDTHNYNGHGSYDGGGTTVQYNFQENSSRHTKFKDDGKFTTSSDSSGTDSESKGSATQSDIWNTYTYRLNKGTDSRTRRLGPIATTKAARATIRSPMAIGSRTDPITRSRTAATVSHTTSTGAPRATRSRPTPGRRATATSTTAARHTRWATASTATASIA